MDDEQRRNSGLGIRRQVLADAHVDRAFSQTTPLHQEFQDLITRYAWGEIWTRPGLDVRSRRILVIGTMIAIGRWEEFEMHAAAAMRQGLVSERAIEVRMPGGTLRVSIDEEWRVTLLGPVEDVCTGTLTPRMLRRLQELS